MCKKWGILTLWFFFVLICRGQVVNNRVEKLLSKMTLEEKIGQMSQLNITTIMTDSVQQHYDSVSAFKIDTAKLIQLLDTYHIGSFLNGRGVSKTSWFQFMMQLQSVNQRHSRLKIPIIYGVDHVHGSSYVKEGTIFPHNLNIAATFDTVFAREMGNVTVYETSALGHSWIFAPVMDLGRNKFWGRYYETFGEDPVVASRMGTAFVHALQDNPVTLPYKAAACVKHFLGYSDPKSGWDRSPSEIPEQILREFYLPSYKAAIDAGAKTLMVNSGELNGIPVHASAEILTKLLREELGFRGVVVTDWLDIISLEQMHYAAETEKEATFMAIQAGVDMSMIPLTTNFCRYLKELVLEKRITEERINQSVRRILELKIDLGLFEHPLPDASRLDRLGKPESKAKALNAARESITLLKNTKQLLPVKNQQKIVVTGALAKLKVSLCGGWTFRFAPKDDYWMPTDMLSLYDALQKEWKDKKVVYASQEELATVGKDADLIVFAAGEREGYAETDGTINTLDLEKSQLDWSEKVFALNKPVVTVLIEGRPRIVGPIFDRSQAVIWAGLPGVEGAQAITEVISGKVNPSGKMPFTYPYQEGHVINYNHKRSEYSNFREVEGDLKRFALAEFGAGLSYTTFRYSNLQLSDTVLSKEKKITANVTLTNTGQVQGKESVLWFLSDEVGSITRPIKELQHFEKISLKPGESKTINWTIIPSEHMWFPDKNGKKILEKGTFGISVGDQKSRFHLL